MKSTLAWTKYGPLEDTASVQDPLALDYFAQTLGNVVLPSFTTRTSRARYYSMVAYGIMISNQYVKEKGEAYYVKDVMEAFKLYEKYWARAVVEHYQNNGGIAERDKKETDLRGKRGAIKAYCSRTVSLDYPFLTRQLELGALGAYRTSMESLDLLKDNLSLTHKGFELAREYLDKRYDKLILEAMKQGKIVQKRGNETLNSLGWHSALDHDWDSPYSTHRKERTLIRDYIIENPKNLVAITLINEEYINSGKSGSTTEIIDRICSRSLKTEEGRLVAEQFKTIQLFEEMAVRLINIWCEVVQQAFEQLGKSSVKECVSVVKPYLDSLVESDLINRLVSSVCYHDVRDSYHGKDFSFFIQNFVNLSETDYSRFIVEMIKYHTTVMARRNSGPWLILNDDDIIANAGFDYVRETFGAKVLHGYKIGNIIRLIEDSGWIGSGKEY